MKTTGCGTAIVTPFTPAGAIDEPALRSLVDWQIESGIDFLVACGSTGEAATLDEDEWLFAVNVVAEAARGRVPVWAGCTHNNTRTLVRQAELLRHVPNVQRSSLRQPLLQQALAGRSSSSTSSPLARIVDPLPVTLYNIPGRTGINLDPETVLRLAETAPNIQAIKESSGKLPQIAQLVHILPAGFKIFSGDDNLALASIGVGAHGLVSVAANEIPAEMRRMIRSALTGDWAEAHALDRRYARLIIDANFWDSNPTPVKTILSLMGRTSDTVRLPLVPPSPATRERLERVAEELGLLQHTAVSRQ